MGGGAVLGSLLAGRGAGLAPLVGGDGGRGRWWPPCCCCPTTLDVLGPRGASSLAGRRPGADRAVGRSTSLALRTGAAGLAPAASPCAGAAAGAPAGRAALAAGLGAAGLGAGAVVAWGVVWAGEQGWLDGAAAGPGRAAGRGGRGAGAGGRRWAWRPSGRRAGPVVAVRAAAARGRARACWRWRGRRRRWSASVDGWWGMPRTTSPACWVRRRGHDAAPSRVLWVGDAEVMPGGDGLAPRRAASPTPRRSGRPCPASPTCGPRPATARPTGSVRPSRWPSGRDTTRLGRSSPRWGCSTSRCHAGWPPPTPRRAPRRRRWRPTGRPTSWPGRWPPSSTCSRCGSTPGSSCTATPPPCRCGRRSRAAMSTISDARPVLDDGSTPGRPAVPSPAGRPSCRDRPPPTTGTCA